MFNPATMSLKALMLYLKNSDPYQYMEVIHEQRKLILDYIIKL